MSNPTGEPRLAAGAVLAVSGLVAIAAGAVTDPLRAAVTIAATAWLIALIPLSTSAVGSLGETVGSAWIQGRLPRLHQLSRPGYAPLAGLGLAVLLLGTGAGTLEPSGSGDPVPNPQFTPLILSLAAVAAWTWLGRRWATAGRKAAGTVFLVLLLPGFWWITDLWFGWFAPACRNSASGFYHWAGLLLLGASWLAWREIRSSADESAKDGFHDLSRFLLFAACLWIYAWICRYLPVWYAGLPGESACFAVRAVGDWRVIHLAVPVANWLLPCALLLAGRAKQDRGLVLLAAGLVLAGRWLDTYLQMVPDLGPLDLFHLWVDHGPVLLALGTWRILHPGKD